MCKTYELTRTEPKHIKNQMRFSAFAMILPLLFTGCTGNPIADGALRGALEGPMHALFRDLNTEKNKNCTVDNPEACSEAWRGISDADFCKRYSPTMMVVAKELERRKLDCSKPSDPASYK